LSSAAGAVVAGKSVTLESAAKTGGTKRKIRKKQVKYFTIRYP
jgi:hypothetical protein